MSGITLGVVGHVDHGKTALVRALTGIETDRLEAERKRGLSIVLGFAFLETPQGVVDLIDVPGHEDFVRAMIGGSTALDGIVLCIAANEGIMPQTVEHFQIARLLGVETGLVVVTKADLVDAARRAAAAAEVARFVRGTFLESAPVLEASVASGAGLDAVRAALARLAATEITREAQGRFFLPLDRVFTMRGFGLVATGTLRGGKLHVGDTVEIQPGGRSATVRGLQNHGRPIEHAVPGQRVAVNLRHVSREEIRRGDVLAAPGFVVPARRLDGELRVLEEAGRAIPNGAVVRVLTGTTEATARLRLLDRRELAPGESGLVQLNLDRSIATRPTERYLIRSLSPPRTLGGGRVLDVNTRRHRRFDVRVADRLESAASGDLERMLRQRLEEAGAAGLRLGDLAQRLERPRAVVEEAAERLDAIRIGEDLWVTPDALVGVQAGILAVLEGLHADQPLRTGLDPGSIASALGANPPQALVRAALKRLLAEGRVQAADELFAIAGHDPFARLEGRERQLVAQIEQAFRAGGLTPPAPQDVVGQDRVTQVIYRLLLETGRLVRLKTYDRNTQIVLHASTVEDVKQALAHTFPYPQTFAVKDVRDLLRSTRRHVVPLMEHLDSMGATVRSGDLRRLRAP